MGGQAVYKAPAAESALVELAVEKISNIFGWKIILTSASFVC